MIYDKLKSVIAIILVMCLMVFFTACTPQDEPSKQPAVHNVIMAVGERMTLKDASMDDVIIEGESVASLDRESVTAVKSGTAKVTLSQGDVNVIYQISVYDRVVDGRDFSRYGWHSTLNEAIGSAKSGDTIFIRSGVYEENVNIDANVSLVGEKDATIGSVSIGENVSVSLRNISLYSRKKDVGNGAFIDALEGCSLEVDDCSFMMDNKGIDSSESKIGYAIYVRANSHKVHINNCKFTGYKDGIIIDATGGDIDIVGNKFSDIDTAVIVDIRDIETDMPVNLDASGRIGDNVFYHVNHDIDFRYAGANYDGKLVVEKHDKL